MADLIVIAFNDQFKAEAADGRHTGAVSRWD
jgi:hypothetical protein